MTVCSKDTLRKPAWPTLMFQASLRSGRAGSRWSGNLKLVISPTSAELPQFYQDLHLQHPLQSLNSLRLCHVLQVLGIVSEHDPRNLPSFTKPPRAHKVWTIHMAWIVLINFCEWVVWVLDI